MLQILLGNYASNNDIIFLLNLNLRLVNPTKPLRISHWIDIIVMEYNELSRCRGGEMIDTEDSKSHVEERGGLSNIQGIILGMLIE